MTEREITEALCEKDEKGLTYLMRHYTPLIKYIVTPILQNAGDIEECVSDIFLLIWEKADLYDSAKGSLTTWISAIARNCALSKKRSSSKHEQNRELDETVPSADPTPEEYIITEEQKSELQRALGKLNRKELNLFYRKYYYMQSVAQIAAETGMSVRATEGKLYRIRNKLKKIMGGDHFGE